MAVAPKTIQRSFPVKTAEALELETFAKKCKKEGQSNKQILKAALKKSSLDLYLLGILANTLTPQNPLSRNNDLPLYGTSKKTIANEKWTSEMYGF